MSSGGRRNSGGSVRDATLGVGGENSWFVSDEALSRRPEIKFRSSNSWGLLLSHYTVPAIYLLDVGYFNSTQAHWVTRHDVQNLHPSLSSLPRRWNLFRHNDYSSLKQAWQGRNHMLTVVGFWRYADYWLFHIYSEQVLRGHGWNMEKHRSSLLAHN